MDSFEVNKLIGAFLATVFVVFSISILSDGIFASHAPEQPGFVIAVPDAPAAGGAVVEERPSIAALLQTADAAAGEASFRKCTACHTGEKGGANKIGPNLWGIVNRPIASHEGFSYSSAMREFSQGGSVHWDYEHLSQFLVAPRSFVSGTAMSFAGIKNPQEEANLIAYLRTLADEPAPLPEPPAAETEAAPEGQAEQPAEDAPAPEAAPASPAPQQ